MPGLMTQKSTTISFKAQQANLPGCPRGSRSLLVMQQHRRQRHMYRHDCMGILLVIQAKCKLLMCICTDMQEGLDGHTGLKPKQEAVKQATGAGDANSCCHIRAWQHVRAACTKVDRMCAMEMHPACLLLAQGIQH